MKMIFRAATCLLIAILAGIGAAFIATTGWNVAASPRTLPYMFGPIVGLGATISVIAAFAIHKPPDILAEEKAITIPVLSAANIFRIAACGLVAVLAGVGAGSSALVILVKTVYRGNLPQMFGPILALGIIACIFGLFIVINWWIFPRRKNA